MEFNIGTHEQTPFRLLLDTGSSNDAVIEECCSDRAPRVYSCAASETCVPTSTQVNVQYADTGLSGYIVEDTFASSALGELERRPFVAITKEDGFYRPDFDGILGAAYDTLTTSTGRKPPTFVTDLVNRNIVQDRFGLLLCGTLQTLVQGQDPDNRHAGQWVLGGLDGPNGEQYYQGSIFYTPIVQEKWYVVTVTDLALGDTSLGLPCHEYNTPRAIVDSGSTNLVLPTGVYNVFMRELKKVMLKHMPEFNLKFLDDTRSCCGVAECDPRSSSSAMLALPPISIRLAHAGTSGGQTKEHVTITIPPEYYWRPERNGEFECRAFGISEGNNFVLGTVFMDGLYTYHDRKEQRMGFATANNCPNDVVSTKTVTISTTEQDWCECLSREQRWGTLVSSFWPQTGKCFYWPWWMYVVVASGVITVIATFVILWVVCCRSRQRRRAPSLLKVPLESPAYEPL